MQYPCLAAVRAIKVYSKDLFNSGYLGILKFEKTEN